MSSILTNNGAMVALQTLSSINSDLSKTQAMISTGKEVASAKDNSSIWAISKVMESDVAGFQAISDSLALGESTLSVAAKAAETVTDLLTDIKEKVVSAQEENVDREKIQTDIDALIGQVKSVVGAAQINGLNLVKGTEDVSILSSLDRSPDGSVTASDITVSRQDLSTSAGSYGGGGTSLTSNIDADTDTAGTQSSTTASGTGRSTDLALDATDWDTANFEVSVGGNTVTIAGDTDATTTGDALAAAINALGLDGVSAANSAGTVTITNSKGFDDLSISVNGSGSGAGTFDIDGAGAGATGTVTVGQRAETLTFDKTAKVNEGDSYRVTVGSTNYDYIAGKGETAEDVVRGLKTAVDAGKLDGVTTRAAQDDNGNWTLQIDNDGSGSASLAISVAGEDGGTASGGLFGLDNIDVTTNSGADAALGNIETLINNAIDAAAEFGSAQGRVETQSKFISNLTDALKSGIGSMVDADMEEASAKLQALQVQQQLGVQSLSIANQAPQTILSLFG
ncbi:flagellin [Celeribacter indicus]|uniref:Flagellin n=1 Tax=Celeribacter indicus TaxID=1208324 RepID=A0A0B5DMD0_9RHOB|nr:flagellin [Celeribacter indicus]AJE44803.1 flagellin-like protein [Celeribacter indicus]SDX24641.1 flagellin [Celeribacter indicus]